MEAEDLSGKRAVVTGASRGIGRHIARELMRAGADVVITGRNEQTLAAAAQELSAVTGGGACRFIVCDHSDEVSVQAFARSVLEASERVDILVNNAGTFASAPVVELPLSAWNRVIGTNLTGVFLTTRALLPAMIAAGRGDIFMIGSMSGRKGDPGASAYCASKFGLAGFSQALQYEVRRHNIRVMVLNPSSVNTGAEGAPHGRGLHLHARDIARTIVHLACLPGRTLVREMDIWGTNP
jgi:3-oxoacyl-[acyl-carrier protein] reductase